MTNFTHTLRTGLASALLLTGLTTTAQASCPTVPRPALAWAGAARPSSQGPCSAQAVGWTRCSKPDPMSASSTSSRTTGPARAIEDANTVVAG